MSRLPRAQDPYGRPGPHGAPGPTGDLLATPPGDRTGRTPVDLADDGGTHDRWTTYGDHAL
jgi:hypothetical protein